MSPVEAEIRRRLGDAGRLPFAEVMDLALYAPGGYYAGPRLPIGEDGDFVTGSSLSALFARATARVVGRLSRALGRPAELFEAGPGNGDHAGIVAATLAGSGSRVRVWDRIERPLPAGVDRVASLDEIASRSVEGLVFSYELFDALPVHRLLGRSDGSVGELWVTMENDDLVWSEGELSDPTLVELLGGFALDAGQVADLAPGWEPLYRRLAARLGRGLLVTCDYGFERRSLLDARVRRAGTLACYSRQRVHRNPFVLLGSQDLTAHVDLTRLREAGEDCGLETVCLTRQALWLLAAGIFEELDAAPAAVRREAMQLLDGEGMGEEIRVLVQARDVDPSQVLDAAFLATAGRGSA